MRITPLDVRKQEFRKAVRGLDADEVHAFLATVADEYEVVLTDNKKLRDRVIELDEKVSEYRNMEKTLRDTLLTAERVMTEARQNARKEADLILRDAQMKASQEVSGISGRVESLHQQIRELRGHRDSYLARLQSLSEAQIGLLESYRKDFESTDQRIERAVEATGVAPAPAVRPQRTMESMSRPVEPVSGASRPVEPVSAPVSPAPAPAPQSRADQDAWRGYSVGDEKPAPELDWQAPDSSGATRIVEELSEEDYQARVASVADAWSGAVPPVSADAPTPDESSAIDEVSAALGMFSEGGPGVTGRAGDRPGATGHAASRPSPPVDLEGPARSGEEGPALASSPIPSEAVEPAKQAAAPSGSDESEGEQGRWSLTRIARGLVGD